MTGKVTMRWNILWGILFWCFYALGAQRGVRIASIIHGYHSPDFSAWPMLALAGLGLHTSLVVVLYVLWLRRKRSRFLFLMALLLGLSATIASLSVPVVCHWERW